jgi:hypothetical protein
MHLLDSYMPEYDRCVRQAIGVRAHAAAVTSSIWQTDLAGCEVVRLLLGRNCGSAVLEFIGTPGRFTIGKFQALGCVVLTSSGGDEVALGAIGRVAASQFEFSPSDAQRFRSADELNIAKVFWHFGVVPDGHARSVLSLETRLRCAGDAQARSMLLHWDALERLRTRARREVLLAMKALAEAERRTSLHRDLGLNGD